MKLFDQLHGFLGPRGVAPLSDLGEYLPNIKNVAMTGSPAIRGGESHHLPLSIRPGRQYVNPPRTMTVSAGWKSGVSLL